MDEVSCLAIRPTETWDITKFDETAIMENKTRRRLLQVNWQWFSRGLNALRITKESWFIIG